MSRDYAAEYDDLIRRCKGDVCVHCGYYPEHHVEGRCLFVPAARYQHNEQLRKGWSLLERANKIDDALNKLTLMEATAQPNTVVTIYGNPIPPSPPVLTAA